MGRVKVDYSNKIILNDYGNEVKILELYEQRKRASYWKYICPYCGKEDVNDILNANTTIHKPHPDQE